jgi:histidinol phosphatase-like enzyme
MKIIKKKTYCFDLDGVICKTNKNFYKKSKPIKAAIEKINSLHKGGNKIIIFTARYMGRCEQKITLAKKRGYLLTLNQLKKWNVKFHKLIFGKPSYDYIIDDKSINYRKDWHKFLK